MTDQYKINIINNMIKLLQAGYEIKLSRSSHSVIEVYKSQSREKWEEKEVVGSYGSGNYWEDGWLRIQADRFSEYVIKLQTNKEHI